MSERKKKTHTYRTQAEKIQYGDIHSQGLIRLLQKFRAQICIRLDVIRQIVWHRENTNNNWFNRPESSNSTPTCFVRAILASTIIDQAIVLNYRTTEKYVYKQNTFTVWRHIITNAAIVYFRSVLLWKRLISVLPVFNSRVILRRIFFLRIFENYQSQSAVNDGLSFIHACNVLRVCVRARVVSPGVECLF